MQTVTDYAVRRSLSIIAKLTHNTVHEYIAYNWTNVRIKT